MPPKTPAEYIESLRDGRVLYWDGERIDDVSKSERFRVPLAVASRDYEYDDPGRRELMTYRAEEGELAHRVYQIPRTEEDLRKRLELATTMSMVGGVTGVFMALQAVKDEIKAE